MTDKQEEKMTCHSIQIQLLNKTITTKTILVFGRDHHIPLTPAIVEEAWQVVRVGPQGRVTFEYPEDTSVGAFYTREDGSQVNIGPYPAKHGTTWTCQMNTQYDDGTMELESKAPPNKHGVYMIYNKPPAAWSGRKLNIGLYKDDKVLLVKRDLRVGDYVELKPTNKLYFCCMESASPSSPEYDINAVFANASSGNRGDSIDFFDAEFTPLTKIDLHQYPNGMEVIVQENEMSGQILFIPKPHYS